MTPVATDTTDTTDTDSPAIGSSVTASLAGLPDAVDLGPHGSRAEGQVLGRRYHVPRFPLTPSIAARFALVVGADPERLGGHAHPCLVARPAVCVLEALLADPGIGADRASMLHAQSDIVWHRPLVVGDEVALDAEVVDAGPYGNRHGLAVAVRVAEPGGAPLVDIDTVLAFTPPALPVAEGRRPLAPPAREPQGTRVVAEHAFAVDTGFPARYAAVSGDTNPIHLDPAAARAAGLPGVVVHGLSTVALGATFAVDALGGGDPATLARMRVRFARPARPGAVASYRAVAAERPGLFALSCQVGGSAIWRHAVVEIRT